MVAIKGTGFDVEINFHGQLECVDLPVPVSLDAIVVDHRTGIFLVLFLVDVEHEILIV